MNLFESFRVAWTALRTNKLRALLTMLGIIIGVGAVIGMLAIGTGLRQFLEKQFNGLGVGTFFVGPFVDSRKVDERSQAQLTFADAQAILQPGVAPAVKAISVEFSSGEVVSGGGKRFNYEIRGITPSHFTIADNTLGAGRYYTDTEEREAARVAVIGQQVAERLFGTVSSALGQRITINGVGFDVVGVLTTKPAPGPGGDPRQSVYVPYHAARNWLFRNRLTSKIDIGFMVVQAQDASQVDAAIAQVTNLLRERHRLTYQSNDFTIINVAQIAATVGGIIGAFNAFLGVVAGISLLVGGIGIMNIMLVSVTERTREIGLRKAVGARRWDILLQFLIEAIVLCLFGGAIGIALGYGLSFIGTFVLVNLFEAEGAQASVTFGSILLATVISGAIGVFFGFWPALQAARLNPI
ncbi:MAG TPA: ABC transporter permease, partial [Roseiflexaceae bacterium]|nr:ABC transporter permease [Roseiflexaceae bacterium]